MFYFYFCFVICCIYYFVCYNKYMVVFVCYGPTVFYFICLRKAFFGVAASVGYLTVGVRFGSVFFF